MTEYVEVATDASERLRQLTALYDAALVEHDAAKTRLDALKAGIKVELGALAGGAAKVAVSGPGLDGTLRLLWVPRLELDTKRLRKEQPDLWETHGRDAGRWELRKVSA